MFKLIYIICYHPFCSNIPDGKTQLLTSDPREVHFVSIRVEQSTSLLSYPKHTEACTTRFVALGNIAKIAMNNNNRRKNNTHAS